MAEELDWVYYDHVASSTTASAVKTLFAQGEAATNSHTTNMPVAGRLLDSEEFNVEEIAVWYETDLAHADLIKLYDRCVVEFLISNNRVFSAPAVMCAPKNKFLACSAAHNDAATTQTVGAAGGPFELRIPIKIPSGASFKLKLTMGHGSTPTDTEIAAALRGRLRRK